MNSLSPAEIVLAYSEAGKKKTDRCVGKMLILAIAAGSIIAFGGASTATAMHGIDNVSVARTICALLFPFGLATVMLLGLELFTGNCMIVISMLERKTTLSKMLRNWGVVYFGNFIGSVLTAAGCAFFGQFNYSGGKLAAYTIKVAAAKCAIAFPNGIVSGILCNVLVCAAVLCCLSAKDTSGKILGAYLLIVFFVLCGFEHCIANMYYIPAGLFAASVPEYARLAAELGVDMSMLTWGNFFARNLVPVTIGNIFGGALIGAVMWFCHVHDAKSHAPDAAKIKEPSH